jgi:hypothetical protein
LAVVEALPRTPVVVAAPQVLELKKVDQERNQAVPDRAETLRSHPAKAAAPAPMAASPTAVPGGVPGGVSGGVVGGVVGGGARAKKAEARTARADLQAPGLVRGEMVISPAWNLETLPDGQTQVTVLAPPYAQALLLQRGPTGLRVVKLLMIEGPGGSLLRWRTQFNLAAGDAVDLYLLNSPVADPAKLPETGVVDGFRARILPQINSR